MERIYWRHRITDNNRISSLVSNLIIHIRKLARSKFQMTSTCVCGGGGSNLRVVTVIDLKSLGPPLTTLGFNPNLGVDFFHMRDYPAGLQYAGGSTLELVRV